MARLLRLMLLLLWLSCLLHVGYGISIVTLTPTDNAKLQILSSTVYPNARCLDGTSYGFYLKQASANASDEAKKSWLVVLNGGGLCTHEADCVARAKTDLGTNTVWTKEFNLDSIAFMAKDSRNPFRDWNMVFMPYCSGDMHAGTRTAATNDTFGLYFSGYNNIVASVDRLSTAYGLNTSGNNLIWSGGSAGGIGVFTSLDRVAASLPTVHVVGAPVGGFPPDVHWSTIKGASPPEEDARTPAFAVNNKLYAAVLPPTCETALGPANAYKCGVPHIAYPYLATPTFIMQSLTDVVVMCGFEGMPCKPIAKALLNPDVWHEMDQFGTNATNLIQATVAKSEINGVFAANCLLHTGFTLDGPLINNTNAVDALFNWYSGLQGSHHYIDSCSNNKFYPPCGHKCPLTP